ncbi:uncharacterized protein LOC121780469 isoform X2 [Salvia splendens]|uniref:uncharacterized protein LOC121780469 isoform X2 n=1 Tax=Salvia splendens TaxID=180675 RepID=UPI001C2769C3|nr:uncharacterized protein LOC121780469 isoform X2 [Salvia splendens]
MADVETVVGEEVTCASLLESLQEIWDEVGETNEERDKVLLRLDRDCLDVYKREFDQAVKSRAHLLHTLADAKDKLTNLLSLLGEKTCVGIPEITSGTIKEQLEAIAPALERLSKLRDDTIKEFYHVRVEEDPPPSPQGKGVSNTPCEGKKNYSLEETKLLARIYANIFEDPLVGSMPKSQVSWGKIAENYNGMKPEWALERDGSGLRRHWGRVQEDLSKFTDHVTNLHKARPSGTSWDDVRKGALRAFYKETKKQFKYEDVWKIVQRDLKLFGDASSDSKRKKLSTSGRCSTSGNACTDPIDLDSRRTRESLHVELAPCGSRPMSHRAAKRKTNEKASSAEEKFLVLSEKMGSVGEAIMIKSYLKALEKDTSRMSDTKRLQHEAAVKLLACKLGLV